MIAQTPGAKLRRLTESQSGGGFPRLTARPMRLGLAAVSASPSLCLLHSRVDSDTPSLAAMT